ncbi:hypothetical protein NXS98_13945 [Fontisphaera persica]|uniref:hypothetical protein n=1 Tax=Fontisphaera persica TaxID=2974023 RepID=UPI0024C08723|nr:hypothetical protein [Fontisphaera persica]WCJ58810.1 hypothetical protein NXS98_13945 [Fontisphaera persica]
MPDLCRGHPGAGYRLQYRGLERDAVWTTLTNFTYNGPATLCDSTATNQARIYRMISP